METTLTFLPEEVKELALRVPAEKQEEVQNILQQVFAGTESWEKQVDAIQVKGIDDKMSIQLADVARKNIKQARLHAEKLFDAKRAEVQARMQNDKLEDSLWLKAKQVTQLKLKAIEEKAEWKAKFIERYEASQKELVTQLRCEKVSKYIQEYSRVEIASMSDNYFDMFLAGVEKTYNERIAAEKKAEEDRIASEKAEKERQEKIRLDNIRLQKEAKEREKQVEADRRVRVKRNEELRPYIIFIRDYNKMISLPEKEYQKEFIDIQRAAKEHYEYEAAQKEIARKDQEKKDALLKKERDKAEVDRKVLEEKARKEKEAREKIEKEIKVKKEVEQKAADTERRRIAAEEKKAKLAPDKTKLLNFMQAINDLPRPEVKSIEAAGIAANANTLLVKVANYILENANKL